MCLLQGSHPKNPQLSVLGYQEGVLALGPPGESVHLGSHMDVPGHTASFPPLKILAWLRQHYLLIDTFPVELTW